MNSTLLASFYHVSDLNRLLIARYSPHPPLSYKRSALTSLPPVAWPFPFTSHPLVRNRSPIKLWDTRHAPHSPPDAAIASSLVSCYIIHHLPKKKGLTHSTGCISDCYTCIGRHRSIICSGLTYKNLSHEGVGVIQQVGANVTTFKVGDRAGWGYLHNSCLHCDQCLSGNEIFCSERALYGSHDTDQGGFASYAVWKADFLFHIPDAISSSDAAPLMCAGATVFTALHMYDLRPTHRVGVVGVGGLGHLAIQFAAKMGCEVVVLSGTDSKKEEAFKLGASEFYATKGQTSIDIGRRIDTLLVTTSMQPDWDLYLSLMTARGTIFPLSVSASDLIVPYMPFLTQGIRIQGSVCASRGTHNTMLRFAAQHGIKPITQEFPLTVEGIEDAMSKLEKGSVRYRAVLVAQ